MQKLKIRWCDIHRLSKLSGSLEDVDSRLDPKAGVPSLASGADSSCWYSAVDCKSVPSSGCVCHLLSLVWVISIIACRHPTPSTLMNVGLTTSLSWVFSGKREETSVFSKTQGDVKSSQTQLPWLWPGLSACLSWCRVLVFESHTILRPFLRISPLTSTPGASYIHLVYYFGSCSSSLVMLKYYYIMYTQLLLIHWILSLYTIY